MRVKTDVFNDELGGQLVKLIRKNVSKKTKARGIKRRIISVLGSWDSLRHVNLTLHVGDSSKNTVMLSWNREADDFSPRFLEMLSQLLSGLVAECDKTICDPMYIEIPEEQS